MTAQHTVQHTVGAGAQTLGLTEATILVNAIQRICDRIRAVTPDLAQDGRLVRQIAALILNDLEFDAELVQTYAELIQTGQLQTGQLPPEP